MFEETRPMSDNSRCAGGTTESEKAVEEYRGLELLKRTTVDSGRYFGQALGYHSRRA